MHRDGVQAGTAGGTTYVSAQSSGVTATAVSSGGGGGAGCTATYSVTSRWNRGGDEQITNVRNSVLISSGQPGVAITNAGCNGSRAPGANTSFGFRATSSGTDGAPSLSYTTN